MAKRGRKVGRRGSLPSRPRGLGGLRGAADGLLHLRTPDEPVWRWLWPVLALAFVVRAGIALYGDSRLHFDEYMQYLEVGHLLAFGNGVMYWEQVYGACSTLCRSIARLNSR